MWCDNKSVVVNMISLQHYKSDITAVADMLEPTPFGLSLPNRTLLRIMGTQDLGAFLRDRENYYE